MIGGLYYIIWKILKKFALLLWNTVLPTSSSSGSMLHVMDVSNWTSRTWCKSSQRQKPPVLKLWAFPEMILSICDFITRSYGKKHHHSVNKWNAYVKIPESSVSVPAILLEIAVKVSIPSKDLVILDLKYVHVTDDEGWYACKVKYCWFQLSLDIEVHSKHFIDFHKWLRQDCGW